MVKVGILGAGSIARTHAQAYEQLPQTRVVAVCDFIAERAETMAAPFQARPYSHWQSFLADREVDMVDICLPTYLHAEGTVATAQAGKHILCEKPVALTLDQVDAMIVAVELAGVKAMVAQVIRFWPGYLVIKDLLDSGELGAPVMAAAARLGSEPQWASWFADSALSGGALLDVHIHDLDWLYYLLGAPASVYAVGAQSASGGWNHLLTSLNFGRMRASAEGSLMMPRGFPFSMLFRLLCTRGYAEYSYGGAQSDPLAAGRKENLVVYIEDQPPQFPAFSPESPYLAEIRYFVDCLDRGEQPGIATLAEARQVLAIALAARRSLETGAVIAL